jgi:hypothetical protein
MPSPHRQGVTLEIKHPVATSNAIVQRVRVGRKQSRRIVIDLRRTGANRDLAEGALDSAIRMYGDISTRFLSSSMTISP